MLLVKAELLYGLSKAVGKVSDKKEAEGAREGLRAAVDIIKATKEEEESGRLLKSSN